MSAREVLRKAIQRAWDNSRDGFEIDAMTDGVIAALPETPYGAWLTLEYYAEEFCEGWCKEAPAEAKFSDCSACLARHALKLAPRLVTEEELTRFALHLSGCGTDALLKALLTNFSITHKDVP